MDVPQSRPNTVTGWPGSNRPAHAARPWRPPIRVGAAVAGAVMLGVIGIAAASCLGSLGPSKSTPTSASLMTVPPAATTTAPSP